MKVYNVNELRLDVLSLSLFNQKTLATVETKGRKPHLLRLKLVNK